MATIGVQASTIKSKFTELGTYETLKKVSELGYNAIEISQVAMTPENVADMRRAQDELGLRMAALSASLTPQMGGSESLTTTFDKIVADCQALGVVVGLLGKVHHGLERFHRGERQHADPQELRVQALGVLDDLVEVLRQ